MWPLANALAVPDQNRTESQGASQGLTSEKLFS